MIDGLDGFQLTPSRLATSRVRAVVMALGAGTALVVVLFAVLAVMTGEPIWWLAIAIYLVLSLPADWVLWRVMQPPVLKADGATITYKSGFKTLNVPRSDLVAIFIDLAARRHGDTTRVKSYVFEAAQGRVTFTIPFLWFRIEDMRAFGERLNVPVSERP